MTTKWTEQQIETFKKSYSYTPNSELANTLNKSKNQIKSKAKALHLKKIHKNKIAPLMGDTCSAFYWVGFFLGDGSYYKSVIKIALAKKDKTHLMKLSDFLDIKINKSFATCQNKKYPYYELRYSSKEHTLGFLKKFNIKPRKTENPPDFSFYKDYPLELILSLFVGLVDADGHIRHTCRHIKLEMHKNWDQFIYSLITFLKIKKVTKRNPKNRNTIEYNIYGKDCENLKAQMLKLKLPYMKRKWNNIKI